MGPDVRGGARKGWIYAIVQRPICCHGFFCVQKLDDTTPQVREAAFEAMGTLLKVMGDRAMTSFVETIDKAKMTKVSYKTDLLV